MDDLAKMIAEAAQQQARQDAQALTPASAPSKGIDKARLARYGMMIGGQGLDAASTVKALHDPRLKEANPIYGKNPSTGRVLATKAALVGAGGLLTDKMAKNHPKAAMVASGILGLSGLIPGMMNLRTMSQVKK